MKGGGRRKWKKGEGTGVVPKQKSGCATGIVTKPICVLLTVSSVIIRAFNRLIN